MCIIPTSLVIYVELKKDKIPEKLSFHSLLRSLVIIISIIRIAVSSIFYEITIVFSLENENITDDINDNS